MSHTPTIPEQLASTHASLTRDDYASMAVVVWVLASCVVWAALGVIVVAPLLGR
jgi:hypothetical protein